MIAGRPAIRYPRNVSWAVLLAALALILAAMGMAAYEESLYQAQRLQEVREQSEILASTVTAALAFDDQRAAREYVNSMRVNPELEAIAIYDAAGRQFAAFSSPGARPAPPALHEGQTPPEADRLVAVATVQQNGRLLGRVYLRAIAEPMIKRVIRYAVLGLLLVMAALVIAALGSTQMSLSRANRTLEAQAEALRQANTKLKSEMEERAKVEDALRQSQKMEAIGQLSGGIAHDFNNLLTIIKGNLQRLEHKLAAGQRDVTRYIEAATEGADRAATLTQRILAFSRKQTLSPSAVDINALVRGMNALVRNSVRENIEVIEHLDARWRTVCDPGQLENVVLNLAINARDAMPLGGKLWIRTEDAHLQNGESGEAPPGDYVRLIVRDNGSGMVDEVREKALEPFFTTKPPGKGTGLGLSMIFGFVRQSGGDMKIDTAPGEGTAVEILLPRLRTTMTGEKATG